MALMPIIKYITSIKGLGMSLSLIPIKIQIKQEIEHIVQPIH